MEVGFVSLLVQLEIALTMAEDGVEEGMLLSLRIKWMNASMTIFYEHIFSRTRLCRFFNFSCLCSKGKTTRETLTLTESWIAVVLSEVIVIYRGFH